MKILLYALLVTTLPAAAQQTSGVIEYEMTARVEAGQFRIVSLGPGGAPLPANAPLPDLPDIITTKQTLTFSGSKAKIETEAMNNRIVMMSGPGNQAAAGGAVTVGAGPGGASMVKNERLRAPVSNTMYIDLVNKKYLNLVEEKNDSTVKGAWYTEEAYKQPGQIKASGKTRTIAGYNCRRATVELGDESFVVWYTEELPMVFSPINGVLPEKGVVLSIESSKRSFVAKKVTLRPVTDSEVSLPAGAQKVTPEELKEKRRQIIERFHNEQLEKFRQAN